MLRCIRNVCTIEVENVPLGKYVLTFSNHVGYPEMVLKSITLTTEGGDGEAALNDITTGTGRARKIVKDGQLLIEHNGKIYNALGASID